MLTQKSGKRKGFTLAEVLITLTIIGVVASLTIPSLINNIGDQQNKTAWKKAFATLSQATMIVAADNGGSLKGLFTDNNTMKGIYSRYLNYIKSCNYGESFGICWHDNDGSAKRFNGGAINTWSNSAGIVLNDGSLLWIGAASNSCTYNSWGLLDCGLLVVDVNGFKTPNTIGKDIFYMHVAENQLKPLGTQGDSQQSSTTCIEGSTDSTNNGIGCAAKYLYQ